MIRCATKIVPGRTGNYNTGCIHADQERGIFIIIEEIADERAGEQTVDVALRILPARLEREIGSPEERIREAITLTNNEIYRLSQVQDEGYVSACSLMVIIVEGEDTTIGRVGNTKLYKVYPHSTEEIIQGTQSSTGREALADSANTNQHSSRPAPTRCLGLKEHDPDDADFIEVTKVSFEPDSALLLCSEKLSRVVSAEDMFRIINNQPGNRMRVVRQIASAAGDRDGIYVLFIEGQHFASALRRYRAANR